MNTVNVALATAAAVTREFDFLWWLLLCTCREEYPKEGFGDFGLRFGFCLTAGGGGEGGSGGGGGGGGGGKN